MWEKMNEMKFDMHCHTKEGSMDGKVPIVQFVGILKHRGYDGMLVSDHNSYNGYRAWQKHLQTMEKAGIPEDFVVLKGIEYDTIDAGHILVIMPNGSKLKILELRGLPVQLLIEIVHKNGGILGPAHPCGEKYLSITNTAKYRNRLSVMDKFDFVEGFNACEDTDSNRRAKELATYFHKPAFGGSDAHKADCIGLAYTELEGYIRNESDLIACVKEGRVSDCGGVHYAGTTKDRLGKANKLLVESFRFYNRLGSIWRHRSRKRELHRQFKS